MSDWFSEAGNGQAVSVTALMDSDAPEQLWTCVEHGAMVSIGLTSDAGALMVQVTLDDRRRREYFRSSEELVDWLGRAAVAVASTPRAPVAPSGPRGRSRRS